MAFANISAISSVQDDVRNGALDILDKKNALTTAGIVTAAGGVIAGGALLTAALPAQTLAVVGTAGTLLYTGHRKSKGLAINPFQKEAEATPIAAKAVETETVETEAVTA